MEELIMLGMVANAVISASSMEFFESLKSLAFVAIVTVICIIGSRIVSYVNGEIKKQVTNAFENSKLAKIDAAHRAMTDAIEIIHSTVERLNETIKKEIISKSADGKLTKDEGKEIFHEAMAIIKSCISVNTKDDISFIVGDIDEWISNQIEIWVAETKNNKT